MHNPYEPPVAAGSEPAAQIVDQRPRLRVLTAVLRLWIVAKVAIASVDVFDGVGLLAIDDWADDDPRLLSIGALGIVHGLVLLAFAVGLFRVLAGAHRNARVIKGLKLFHSVFALIAWFFVPIGQLFVPFEKVREVWLASTPPGRTPIPPPPSFSAWWAGWAIACIGMVFLGNAASVVAYADVVFTIVTAWALVWAGMQAVETLRRLDALQREHQSQ